MFISSTVNQFKTSTVSTSLISSTESIGLAKFPKIVICNKYQLRWARKGRIKMKKKIHLRRDRTVCPVKFYCGRAISKILKQNHLTIWNLQEIFHELPDFTVGKLHKGSRIQRARRCICFIRWIDFWLGIPQFNNNETGVALFRLILWIIIWKTNHW